MSGQDWALIISALGTTVTAIIGALVLLLRKDQKATHETVNSRQTEMSARIGQLAAVITAAGKAVPPARDPPPS